MDEQELRSRVLDILYEKHPNAVHDYHIWLSLPEDITEERLDECLLALQDEGLAERAGNGFFSMDWRLTNPLVMLASQSD